MKLIFIIVSVLVAPPLLALMCSFWPVCLPLQVSQSMAGIVAADSVSHALQVQQWDGEVRQESKHAADLKQLDNGVKIPPR